MGCSSASSHHWITMKVLSLTFMSVVIVAADNEVRRGSLLMTRKNILPQQGEHMPVKRMASASPNPKPLTTRTPLSTKFVQPSEPLFSNTQQFSNTRQIINPQPFNNPPFFNIIEPISINEQNIIDPQSFNNQYQFNDQHQHLFNSLPFNQEQQQFNHNQFNGYFGPYNKPCNRHFTHHYRNHFNHNSPDNHFNHHSFDNNFNHNSPNNHFIQNSVDNHFNHNEQHFGHPHYQFPVGNQLHGNQNREFHNDLFNEIQHEHRFNEFNDNIEHGPSQHPRSG